ncbi:phage tail protein [Testudinibacter sp. TR-2022]|uniref:phage baseplate assembly protein n=1 Tax=Testudinibacter sp. TR-2022 TaxID=2585029 RepID=UPI0011199F2A|nr:contractile injection system protein, VgrG/Pvc8 family [Testudinibacter sp. TR-2022]TNH03165.1 phage tail protein [Pasteurellaceae bacterium Phil31]TNH07452.1 phage tail protein [Testudinibacter sp. TR-2022]TNH07516.1 phage tail protein [Testudinibacter sp. TR-2022]TNH13215.1 phage tail protein [Testudinibacter sp. TR-2022]TNH18457.1 phage tail protein [Testudinibacter sp. TR-2022]
MTERDLSLVDDRLLAHYPEDLALAQKQRAAKQQLATQAQGNEQQEKLTDTKVELFLNGKIFSGWKTLSVFRSLEAMSGQFDLGIAVRPEDDVSVLKAGSSLILKMGGQTVITGYLDELRQRIEGENKEVAVSGRDKTADLVDCAVIHSSYQFKGQTLKQIAETICKPFGINVVWVATEAGATEVIPVWQVEPGETAFDTLSKAARHKGVLVTSDVDGNLVFTDPGKTKVGNLILGQNLLSLEVTDSWAQRFSLYRIIGDAEQGGAKGDKQTKDESELPLGD